MKNIIAKIQTIVRVLMALLHHHHDDEDRELVQVEVDRIVSYQNEVVDLPTKFQTNGLSQIQGFANLTLRHFHFPRPPQASSPRRVRR
jgi:hypothetical protein